MMNDLKKPKVIFGFGLFLFILAWSSVSTARQPVLWYGYAETGVYGPTCACPFIMYGGCYCNLL